MKKILSALLASLTLLLYLFASTVHASGGNSPALSANAYTRIPSINKYYLPWKSGDTFTVTRAGSTHNRAIDVAMPKGTPLYSIGAGKILKIVQHNTKSACDSSYKVYNNYISIQHSNGEISYYYHIDTNSVPPNLKVGQNIARGTLIAQSGKIGYVCGKTGEHLHFEMKRNGVRIDPRFADVANQYVVGGKSYKSGNKPTLKFTGNWYLNPNNAVSNNTNLIVFKYGMAGDIPIVGDWNGDGIDTAGVFRPSNATWYLNPNNAVSDNTNLIVFQYGMAGDIPIVGDWDGDGIDTVGVFRPSEAKWYLNPNNAASDNTNLIAFQYGFGTDTPIVGDWNGDGVDTVGVFRPSEAKWYLNPNNAVSDSLNLIVFQYGFGTDTPIVGDWNGDGTDTVGVFRHTDAKFYLNPNNAVSDSTNLTVFQYGMDGDTPLTGDWNNDGISTVGVVR